MKNKKYIESLIAKVTGYNLFSALLCQPDAEVISKPDIFNTLLNSYRSLTSENTDNFIALKSVVKKYSPQNLLVEYTRLFIGPGKIPVPPYAGLYFNGIHLMSDETLWVINFYSDNGLEFDPEIKDGPDHIAVETEFIYYLIYNEIKELKEKNYEKARVYKINRTEFFSKHYLKWVPIFCYKIFENTTNDYYKTLAFCLISFIRLDMSGDKQHLMIR